MKTREQKLDDIEIRLKRWLTRGMRAQNAVNKLLKQQARLKKTPAPKAVMEEKIADAFAPPPSSLPDIVQAIDDRLTQIIEAPLTIPPELDRSDPLVAEKMTAARKAAEAAARKAMPLNEREALKHIRRKS